jgi:ceramide glucosyltransferase
MISLLWLLALGALIYCFLVLAAVYRYLSVAPPVQAQPLPISILKPLKGVDLGLKENLQSFFEQSYSGPWEIIFALASSEDPARLVLEQLQIAYPQVKSSLLIVGESPYNNAKVWSLEKLSAAASYDLLVMADSDITNTSNTNSLS